MISSVLAYQNAAHLNPSDGEAWGNLGAAFADVFRYGFACGAPWDAAMLSVGLDGTRKPLSAFEEALRLDPGFSVRWPEVASHYDRSLRETERSRQEGGA